MLSDSSHPQEQTPPKVFSSPTNVPNTLRNGTLRLHQNSATGAAQTLLPNKMSMSNLQQNRHENGRNLMSSSSEKVEMDRNPIFKNHIVEKNMVHHIYCYALYNILLYAFLSVGS